MKRKPAPATPRPVAKPKVQVKMDPDYVVLPDAGILTVQEDLARVVYHRIRDLGLTQTRVAGKLGLKQSHLSKLMSGQYAGFSAERLFRILIALEQDVHITVQPKPETVRRRGRVSVSG